MATVPLRRISLDAAIVGAGGLAGLVFASQLDSIHDWVTHKVINPADRALTRAKQFLATYAEVIAKEEAFLDKQRRHDNLDYYRYLEVGALEGLFVAEEYDPESIKMAEAPPPEKSLHRKR